MFGFWGGYLPIVEPVVDEMSFNGLGLLLRRFRSLCIE